MTTLTLAFSRAVAATLRPGDRIVGTRLDHDANVTPWRLACDQAGAEQVLAPFDPTTGLLDPADVIALIDERTRWVTLPGASNLIGTVPDLAPIVAAAHDAGARVFVDAVHLAPHKPIDVAALGCDVLACSPYKWYGPHAGVLCADPALLDELPERQGPPGRRPRARASGRRGRRASSRSPPSTPPPGSCSTRAWTRWPRPRRACSPRCSTGCWRCPACTSTGPPTTEGRTPTVAFTVDGTPPDEVAAALAAEPHRDVGRALLRRRGRRPARPRRRRGGVVRAGVSVYVDADDVQRLAAARRPPRLTTSQPTGRPAPT